MAEIKNLIFGTIIAIFFVTVIIIGASNSVVETGVVFDNASLSKYNKLAEINNMSQNIREQGNEAQTNSVLDILGDFFKTGYKSVVITKESIDIVQDMAVSGIDDSNLGDNANNFKGMVVVLIILVVIFAILAILVGREL